MHVLNGVTPTKKLITTKFIKSIDTNRQIVLIYKGRKRHNSIKGEMKQCRKIANHGSKQSNATSE